ncbi:His-Xaa-Ser repeat protein HxsA, partial [Escherichia coli]|nr:His-Xaa-Ser repeat protein HxsA [Escherichia coli]
YPKTYSSPSSSGSSSSGASSSSSSSSVRALRSNDNNRTTNTSSVGTSEVNRTSNGLASDAEKRKRLIMRVQFALLDRGFYNGNIDG